MATTVMSMESAGLERALPAKADAIMGIIIAAAAASIVPRHRKGGG